MGMVHISTLTFFIYIIARTTIATRNTGETHYASKYNAYDNKKARDVIASFVNAWKTSKIIPNYEANKPNQVRSFTNYGPSEDTLTNLAIDKLNFLSHRKNKLDKQSLFALRNSLDPKPINKHVRKPSHAEARAYFGQDRFEEEGVSPELKLASLVSQPIYHNVPKNSQHETEEDYKEFMFPNNDDVNDNRIGLPNDDWRARRRSTVPKNTVRLLAIEDNGERRRNDAGKRYAILNSAQLEDDIRRQRNSIPSGARDLIDQDEIKRILETSGDKKELITDPYSFISLPVSDSVKSSGIDRKFYKSSPDALSETHYADEYPSEYPSEFKLQKKQLWGNIEKRWRRSKVDKRQQVPEELIKQLQNTKRSYYESLGENGNSFDAYGSIGQDMPQSLMKLASDKNDAEMKDRPCKESASVNAPVDMQYPDKNAEALADGSQLQQDMSRASDNGVIQLAPDGPQKRSDFKVESDRGLRQKRAAILMRKKILEDALSKKVSKSLQQGDQLSRVSEPSSRSLGASYLGGLPDSRGTESYDGITEDNEQDSLESRLAHDSTPLLMKIAQHDGALLHKYWNNKHSAGNGFYTGHGEGPNTHAYLGDYFGHGPDEMERDDGVQSLESSPSSEDHHTASLIDSIWEHDLGDGHLGEHHIEGRHSGSKIKSYFGGHHPPGILLPTETMDGIDTHWTGHLPHLHGSDYDHNDGRPVDFPPSRIKAIQAIQDDPAIDAELNPHDGIGTPMGSHGGHHVHAFNHMGHSYGGMGPVMNDPVNVEDSHEEEYKQHIDNLLNQYHGLEERLRGTEGTLSGHLDSAAFGHHGQHHLHTGYDMYAYKNPWDGMKIPYHVPVINHPSGEPEESPPSPLNFGGKTDEKGGPVIEGGKEEGGKGGPLVEGSKITTIKEGKEKEGESPKGAKESDSKNPLPIIPKQRGGPDVSSGKNSTNDNQQKSTAENEAKQSVTDSAENKSGSTNADSSKDKASSKDNDSSKDKASSRDNDSSKDKASSKDNDSSKDKASATNNQDNSGSKQAESNSGSQDSEGKAGSSLSEMVENMMNSSGKQSEMLNNLKTALGDQATNPKSLAALQFSRLKQLGTLQKTLLSSLAKQALQAPKETKPEAGGSEMNEMKQLIELQNLQQLGAGVKAGSLINVLRQNSLLHSLKAAQENMLRNAKIHASMKETTANNNKQHETSKIQASEIQKFFGKLPISSLSSDLGDVGSEKLASKIHSTEASDSGAESDVSVSELIKGLELAHARKTVPVAKEATVKNSLGNLLSESFLSKLRTRQTPKSKSHLLSESSSNKAYSTIGNEGPSTSSTEESPHTRTTHTKSKKKAKSQTKHKKTDFQNEVIETGVTKAEISSHNIEKMDEDELSKKTVVKKVPK